MTEQEFRNTSKEVFKEYGKVTFKHNKLVPEWLEAVFYHGRSGKSKDIVARFFPEENKACVFYEGGCYGEEVHTTIESFKTQLEDVRDTFTYVFMINFRKNYKEKEQ